MLSVSIERDENVNIVVFRPAQAVPDSNALSEILAVVDHRCSEPSRNEAGMVLAAIVNDEYFIDMSARAYDDSLD
jgi:hypothetical protein